MKHNGNIFLVCRSCHDTQLGCALWEAYLLSGYRRAYCALANLPIIQSMNNALNRFQRGNNRNHTRIWRTSSARGGHHAHTRKLSNPARKEGCERATKPLKSWEVP